MAMTKESMRARIVANIQARNSNLNPTNKAILDPYIEDICDGIIEEIKANIEINITVANVQPGVATIIGTKQSVL
jgi:hypothetical protein